MELIFNRDALGPPPDRLADAEKKAWRDIEENCPPGVFAMSDRIWLELAAGLLVKVRECGTDAAELMILHDMLDKCFMTPAGKQKLGVLPLGPKGL